MVKKFQKFAAVALIGATLSGCVSDMGTKQTVGAVAGAAGGAILGSNIGKGKGQLAAVAAGTLLGAFIGSEVGKSLDRADQLAATQATQQALEKQPDNSSTNWNNPNSGNSGQVTPVRTYQAPSGQYCREFNHTIYVGGKAENAYGTACRMPDGSWQIQ